MADLTLTCPHCGQGIKLPATITESDHDAGRVVLQLSKDQAEGMAHLDRCRRAKALPAPTVPRAELVGRVHRMLDMRAFIATGGSRACTLCGVNGQDCQVGLEKNAAACCAGCHNGNTHPAPGEAKGTCAQWAEDHHGADS